MAPKSMTVIFAELQANRREARAATMQFVVMPLTKSGTPCKVTAQDMQHNATRTQEEAETRQAALAAMNPSKTFIILAL